MIREFLAWYREKANASAEARFRATRDRFEKDKLVAYLERRASGVVHTPEYDAAMTELSRKFPPPWR